MKYSYKFWKLVLTPIDRITRLFNYHIVLVGDSAFDVIKDGFDYAKIMHESKIKYNI